MADITMCTNLQCPKAPSCYRIQAPKSDWQSLQYFHYEISANGIECRHYLPMYSYDITNTTDTVE